MADHLDFHNFLALIADQFEDISTRSIDHKNCMYPFAITLSPDLPSPPKPLYW
jgi:hypothetical protein